MYFIDVVYIYNQLTLNNDFDEVSEAHFDQLDPSGQKGRFPREEIVLQDYNINLLPEFPLSGLA